jgi:hypothetical protein
MEVLRDWTLKTLTDGSLLMLTRGQGASLEGLKQIFWTIPSGNSGGDMLLRATKAKVPSGKTSLFATTGLETVMTGGSTRQSRVLPITVT